MARRLPIPNGRLDGALDANGMRIVNLAEPMSDDDAATKGFVRKNAVNAGVISIEGRSGELRLGDIGALPKTGGEVGSDVAAGILRLLATYVNAPSITLDSAFDEAGSISVDDSVKYKSTGEGPRASIKKGNREVATEDQLAVALDLVVEGTVADRRYALKLNGVTQTFDQVKALAETRNAVVRDGQEMYRATYVGSTEMAWDRTGTVQGAVKTVQIQMLREGDGDVVRLVPAKELALKSDIPPAPSGARVTIVQGGAEKGSFTLNQAEDVSINLEAGGGGGGDGKPLVNVYAFGAKGPDGYDQSVDVGGHVVSPHQAEWSVKVDDIPVISWDIECMALVGAFRADSVEVSYDGYRGEGVGYMAVKADGVLLKEGVTQITKDTTLTIYFDNCLLSGTRILMADGSTKCIEDVHAGDVVASVNPVTGRLESDTVAASDAYCRKVVQSYDRWTFADGTVVETANRHRFWNVDLGEFMYLEAWKTGERALMHDGRMTALVSHEVVEEEATHHTLYTRSWNNYVANGLVSGNRKSKSIVHAEP